MSKIIDKNRLDLLDDPEEEKELLEAYEKGLLEPVENPEERREELRMVAKATIAKTKHISVRLTERDFHKIKAKALEIGIPYHTLIGSVLHQFATGKIPAAI